MRRLSRLLPGRSGTVLAAVLMLCLLAAGHLQAAAPLATTGEPSLWGRWLAWIFTEQRAWHRDLVEQMRQLSAADGGTAAATALILASFLYGLFHAAGPGHGKVILASYLLTHRQRVGRGIALAVASSFCQGAVAVLLIYGLLYGAGLLPRDTRQAVDWVERGSFALLAALGLWLALRALRDGLRLVRANGGGAGGHHHRGHDHACEAGCGHGHAPSSDQIERAGDLRGAIGVLLSVGLRPCSGAVLVLVLAQALALPLAGIGAVAAMSAGTALAVAGLALLTVHARGWAATLAGGRLPASGAAAAGAAIRVAGGTLILFLGASLLAQSFAPAHPLGM